MISGARAGRTRARGVSPAFLLHWGLGELVCSVCVAVSPALHGPVLDGPRAPPRVLTLSSAQLDGEYGKGRPQALFGLRSTLESVCSSFLYSCPVLSSRRRRLHGSLCCAGLQPPASSRACCRHISEEQCTIRQLSCQSGARTGSLKRPCNSAQLFTPTQRPQLTCTKQVPSSRCTNSRGAAQASRTEQRLKPWLD